MSDISEEVNRFKHLTIKDGADGTDSSADRFKWWNVARFGWFTSWGLFSLLERGEWVALAQEAGMKYMYFMPRHHDGFCIWDTKTTDYSSTKTKTKAKRDFMADCVEACRKADMPVGFFYSVMDWRLPAFWNVPQKDPEGFAKMREYVHEQVRELVTNYGKIDLIWWDAKIPHSDEDWKWRELIARIKSNQKDIIMNAEDFDSSEGDVLGSKRPWEASVTIDDIWWGITPVIRI